MARNRSEEYRYMVGEARQIYNDELAEVFEHEYRDNEHDPQDIIKGEVLDLLIDVKAILMTSLIVQTDILRVLLGEDTELDTYRKEKNRVDEEE